MRSFFQRVTAVWLSMLSLNRWDWLTLALLISGGILIGLVL